mgnify:FL=1
MTGRAHNSGPGVTQRAPTAKDANTLWRRANQSALFVDIRGADKILGKRAPDNADIFDFCGTLKV